MPPGNLRKSIIFYLFWSLQNSLNGKNFNSLEDCKRHLEYFFAQKDEKFWEDEIMKLPGKWQKAVEQKSFPGGPDSKESSYNGGDLGSIPGSGTSPGEGHGNPLHYSCLENPMERGACQATVHGVAKSQTQLK